MLLVSHASDVPVQKRVGLVMSQVSLAISQKYSRVGSVIQENNASVQILEALRVASQDTSGNRKAIFEMEQATQALTELKHHCDEAQKKVLAVVTARAIPREARRVFVHIVRFNPTHRHST